jgi:hypothetical protein
VRTYRYIFYRMYAWNRGMWGDSDGPQFNVCLWLSQTSVVNVLSLCIIFGWRIVSPRYVVVLLFLVSLFGHWLYFVRSGRFRLLASEFAAAPRSYLRSGAVVWLYGVGPFVLFLWLLAHRD